MRTPIFAEEHAQPGKNFRIAVGDVRVSGCSGVNADSARDLHVGYLSLGHCGTVSSQVVPARGASGRRQVSMNMEVLRSVESRSPHPSRPNFPTALRRYGN